MVVASLVDSLSKIGAIGGIISFIGVGLMILLVAAQSRQIRAMREWIDAEPERQAETAQRVIAEVQRRIAAARERRAAQAAGVPVVPGQPRQVPPAPGTLGATPEARAVAAAKATDTASGAATEVLPEGGSVPPPGGGDSPGEPPVFAPLTPAGADGDDEPSDNGSEPLAEDLSVPPPLDPGQDTQLSDTVPGEYDPLAASTPAAGGFGSGYADDPYDYDDEHLDEPRGNRALFGVGAAALVAGIVIAGFVLFGGGGDDTNSGSGPQGNTTQNEGSGGGNEDTGDTKKPTTPTEIEPSTIRVTVLNGTKVNGLAAKITDRLAAANYTTGQPNSYSSDSTVATSIVEYRAGTGNEAKAKQIAESLGLESTVVQPIDANVSAAAPETADVVVLTGQDLAGATSGTTG
ncbi:MAG: LytR C-terminal domain-containing protein [Solirubrobacteraceae bacterium]|nr:LytR C-terminal domain-containing protein [Solirubrobacteraceae bacterium]